MPEQQGQGHYPSKAPGNASAGPSGTQQSAQDLAKSHGTEFGTGAGVESCENSDRIQPNG